VSLTPVLTASEVSIGQGSISAAPDGTFSFSGIMPGRYTVRSSVALADTRSGWVLKSSIVNGRDASDDPIEIKPGEHITNAVIRFVDTPTELSGTLQDATGRPASDYFVIVFPADKTLWRSGTRRLPAPVRPSTNGLFTFRNLLPGNYLLAALADFESGQQYDSEFLAQLVDASIKVAIAEGEKKLQDIRIR
jgi:hypothetical protein